MNIVYAITRADAVGGATIHVRDLAGAMIARGHRATVLVGGQGSVTELLAAAGIPFRSVPSLRRAIHPVADLRALAETTALLRELAPDLVSAHTAKAGWVARAASARLGLPAIYTPHGWSLGPRVSPAAGVFFATIERVASRWARVIVCVCESEKELALSQSVAPASKLAVVYNGVGDVGPELRAHPEAGPVRLCSVARFQAPKDHATLLRALASLRSRDWRLDLVGDGPLEGEMRALAAALGIAGQVNFLGYQREPACALARAHVFVLSSRSEAFPRSVLEAMRAGLPVVASDVGGVGEAVAAGVHGLLVPAQDPVALAAAAGKLIADPSLRQRLGAAARTAYESRFRAERMVEDTLAIYNSVLGVNTGSGV